MGGVAGGFFSVKTCFEETWKNKKADCQKKIYQLYSLLQHIFITFNSYINIFIYINWVKGNLKKDETIKHFTTYKDCFNVHFGVPVKQPMKIGLHLLKMYADEDLIQQHMSEATM